MEILAPIFMEDDHKIILNKLKAYLEKNPNQRFGQALFNLGINQFMENKEFQLRDIYGDTNSEILFRIENSLSWLEFQAKVNAGVAKVRGIGGMTVNERLYASGLIEVFDKAKEHNKEQAAFILKALNVDEKSIEQILK